MQNKIHIPPLLILLTFSLSYGQNSGNLNPEINTSADSIAFVQLKTDTIFDSMQIINLLILQKSAYKHFSVEFGYSQSKLRTASAFAKDKNAVAAINGGFFNMDSGGSVTYFELNDSVISRTRDSKLKWGIADNIINGAIVITKDSSIAIQAAKSEQFYEKSAQESAVLVAGPLLLLNAEALKLPNTKFVTRRHPRTCLCTNDESVVFITIDGRNQEAEGMTLPEAQKFLAGLGCIDAINLDGGGSTTMWIKHKGVVNFPSDRSGERRVANALLILRK